ncbi:DUF2779 domain-containing protein [Desulfosudis oleivorans]|uniref:DUF2779 domain-containing protein n=1 Tax=Desulfosudis oleivorans (strain DSM 6200 / JCM 39069 / Hxd3) TaxID=96561 RepID=A8ZS33_DESOH|nr:DUF2779 domain-containing protein [Desulfosudis oleivorans]ABW66051.1 conserved hypothetical protein [Desulfosudis oleivorans Hxd3]
MHNHTPRISKSQYLRGLQCPKSLWYYRHRPDLAPETPPGRQALFDAGHEVGVLAQQYFKTGIEITEDYLATDKAICSTQKAVADGHIHIFEATAAAPDGAFSKIDILKKVGKSDAWDLVEVKMSTGVKDYHVDDMALQRHAFTGAGYNIRKSILMHINNQYVRSGDLDLLALFTLADCTEQVTSRLADVDGHVARLLDVIRQQKEPDVAPGDHCFSPFECDYTGHCWPTHPPRSVYDLFPTGPKLNALLARDITLISEIPDDFRMTNRQQVLVQACKTGQVQLDPAKIQKFLLSLKYPLYFLDYETINNAVPLFDRTRPYQQVPFQFSLHVQNEKNGPVNHVEFLSTEKTDPRPAFIEKLIAHCGTKGSVIVYNKAFEKRINDELGRDFPQFKPALNRISTRMVDLLVPFRSRHLYHPDMNGSASLKSVLPAFVPHMRYDTLEISDGGAAAQLYLSCLKDALPAEEQQKVFDNLRVYCGQDTLAEVKLLEVMYGLV